MILAEIREVSIRYRGPLLLDRVSCRISRGQRIGLLGRNGSGKTTLMRLLCGEVEPDAGEAVLFPNVRVAILPQDLPSGLRGPSRDIVAAGLSVDKSHQAPWRVEQRVKQILSRMTLDGDAPFEVLSSGMKRRVLLARALVSDPELLLLDEPTNHLDIDAIDWLERFLNRWDGTFMFVTHDRMLLRALASRILELDRGQLYDWTCDYDTFLKRREQALAAEAKQNALFDKRLAQEEAWIRQGIKARRTRNEGRVRALQRMRRQRQQRRSPVGNVRMKLHQEMRSGNVVVQAEDVSFAYDERPVIRDFSTTILRGDKVGIIGANGSGKTTLLRLLVGQLPAARGRIRLGTNLQIAYFDQQRAQLDEEKTVWENVGDGYDTIHVGDRSHHIVAYLQDFLFSAERARTPIRLLSGGERNRVLLARLFAKPVNVLVLDEPTNDLDVETLELLEERLVKYDGTVLLVSHDRAFLNNVVVSTIVFEHDQINEYVGGYDDWLRQRPCTTSSRNPSQRGSDGNRSAPKSARSETPRPGRDRRLTFRERQDLAALPGKIKQLEAEIAELQRVMCSPEFYKSPREEIVGQSNRLKELERQVEEAYQRWAELDERSNA
jgi:ATP-binding cassette subfamily F protein uup